MTTTTTQETPMPDTVTYYALTTDTAGDLALIVRSGYVDEPAAFHAEFRRVSEPTTKVELHRHRKYGTPAAHRPVEVTWWSADSRQRASAEASAYGTMLVIAGQIARRIDRGLSPHEIAGNFDHVDAINRVSAAELDAMLTTGAAFTRAAKLAAGL